MKRSEMSWYSAIMLCEVILISFLVQRNFGFDLFEGDRKQGLIPLSRLGRAGYLTLIEEKKQSGGMLPYPRVGRQVLELPQTVIPYPRAGRTLFDSETDDYDIMMTPQYIVAGIEDPWENIVLDSQPIFQKRRTMKLIPRIGRKKRSVPEEHDEQNDGKNGQNGETSAKSDMKPVWGEIDDLENTYYYYEPDRQTRGRNAFVPRVGKKSYSYGLGDISSKRAMAFTPRIGRAPLIPRIGRNDNRFQVKSRGAFIPRIGRRASLTPRVGRSSSYKEVEESE